jgi:hypothetical protein
MVPGGGVEPPRAGARRILSPLRLPVPPSRLGKTFASLNQFWVFAPIEITQAGCRRPLCPATRPLLARAQPQYPPGRRSGR